MVTRIAFKIIIKVAKIRTTYVQCVVRNELNLGLTFRNQFQALAIEYNGDIEEVTNNWISNADI